MKREPKRVGVRYRGLDTGNRRIEWIDRVVLVFRRILDGAPDQPRFRGEANGLRNIFRFIAETVLEVSGNWQIGGTIWASASSREMPRRPIVPANPPLDVASAL